MKILWQEGLFLWHAAAFSLDADHGMSFKLGTGACAERQNSYTSVFDGH